MAGTSFLFGVDFPRAVRCGSAFDFCNGTYNMHDVKENEGEKSEAINQKSTGAGPAHVSYTIHGTVSPLNESLAVEIEGRSCIAAGLALLF